jgi:hypothetical protein
MISEVIRRVCSVSVVLGTDAEAVVLNLVNSAGAGVLVARGK